MILRLIMLGAVLLLIYRSLGGSLALSSKDKQKKEIDSDELIECDSCGTYVTQKDSIKRKGRVYCSKECLNKNR